MKQKITFISTYLGISDYGAVDCADFLEVTLLGWRIWDSSKIHTVDSQKQNNTKQTLLYNMFEIPFFP